MYSRKRLKSNHS